MSDNQAETRERTPLDLEAIRTRIAAADRVNYEFKEKRSIIEHDRAILLDEVERLRSLAPGEARQEPDTWAVERDGLRWETYGPEKFRNPKEAAEREAAFWEGRAFGSRYHTARAFPLYREPSQQVHPEPAVTPALITELEHGGPAARELATALKKSGPRWPLHLHDEPIQQNDGWRPIESAPKGERHGKAGPMVLLWAPHWREVASGWYINGRWVDNSSGGSYHPTMWHPMIPAPREQSGEEKES